jgi:hypothetical protein
MLAYDTQSGDRLTRSQNADFFIPPILLSSRPKIEGLGYLPVAPAIRITNYSVEGTHQGIRVNLSPKVALKWRKEE